jgi:hypothetical protein
MTDDLIKELRSYPAHYVAAHRAADALEKAERNMNAREYHNIYLEDQIIRLGQANETMREYIAQQQLDIVTLGQEVGRLREALERIADTDPDEGTEWFHDVARAGLWGKRGSDER